jgi:hypothetical protein
MAMAFSSASFRRDVTAVSMISFRIILKKAGNLKRRELLKGGNFFKGGNLKRRTIFLKRQEI